MDLKKYHHTWKINGYGNLIFQGDIGPSLIQSDQFPKSSNETPFQFFLRIYPRGVNSEKDGDFISVFLHLHDGPDVSVECKLKLINFYKNRHLSKTISGSLNKFNDLGIGNLGIDKINLLPEGYLINNSLTIICEIEIFNNYSIISNDPISNLESTIIKSSNQSNASLTAFKHSHSWGIADYKSKHCDANGLSTEFDFPECNLKLKHADTVQFSLRLWPKGKKGKIHTIDDGSHLSLFLYLFETQNCLNTLSRLSILDVHNFKQHQKWICGQLAAANGLGCERYIKNNDLFEREDQLLPEKMLKINCEIELIEEMKLDSDREDDDEPMECNSNSYIEENIKSMNMKRAKIESSVVLAGSKIQVSCKNLSIRKSNSIRKPRSTTKLISKNKTM